MSADSVTLIKIIGKDFEIDDQLSEEALRHALVNVFADLIANDFQKLLQILYRADVDQYQLKVLLETKNSNSAEIIADAYLDRQKAKIETWKKYNV